MADKPWKQFERESAALVGGRRFWANAGERIDFEGKLRSRRVIGQCKQVKSLSLEALTKLVEEISVEILVETTVHNSTPGYGIVCVQVRRGRGQPSTPLVVMSFDTFRRVTDGS